MIFNLLADGFEGDNQVIHLHVDDLTHAESLIQPPANGNCLNWILGHVIASRHFILELLGEPALWDDAQIARYKRNSEPVTGDGDGVLPLETLLHDLDQTGARIVAAIRALSPEDAERPVEGFSRTLDGVLLFQYWHEAYHIGQMDFSRKLAGKTDKQI